MDSYIPRVSKRTGYLFYRGQLFIPRNKWTLHCAMYVVYFLVKDILTLSFAIAIGMGLFLLRRIFLPSMLDIIISGYCEMLIH